MNPDHWIVPDWPAPARVRALMTTRAGGVSSGGFASLNLGDHVGDDPLAVAENRRRVTEALPGSPVWLNQVHGVDVVVADETSTGATADASLTRRESTVCAVMTADCLPVLFCDVGGRVVAAAHAGWRGLHAGVLERTVSALGVPPAEVMAWLGAAIGPEAFEVGDEVRAAFVGERASAAAAFKPGSERGKWLADLFLLARQRLAACGVTRVYGGGMCTVSDPRRFFSYRRDGQTGRMAAMVWLS
ncbi:peptidoglycan editing factor PgeF [Denitromonas iodatirespirans]|uniref:Purine nucleoside phosphorylase n=1 Tax=Denitromonas iodatirespirans TaxID=2795389 RepID=A0A944DCD1_DENI1|nr:peptidoglycan editing factor PgeF [Denitromonas iodatirespirans]MBT0963650.1 peptidoglycan editing factor PgeF [Denitromonas iodatirespirans]